MATRLHTLAALATLGLTAAPAQDDAGRASSSIYLQALPKADVTVAYDISATGRRFSPTWGLDQAWLWDRNLYKGLNHMGRENIGVGRSAYRFTEPLVNGTQLSADQVTLLRERAAMFDIISPTLPIVFTADQAAGTSDYYVSRRTTPWSTTYTADADRWAAMINGHVAWMADNTRHPVMAVSPFNEGDYWTAEEGATPTLQYQVAQKLKQNYPHCRDVAMVGGNTLNNDKALDWYTPGKEYYDWGNTHQLAGSFDSFAAFYRQVAADGKVGYADEMHNVGEAMVGLEYGMTVGIWWGFDSRARGEFCQFSRHGCRIGYGEHRQNWTAASVYRHDDGRVRAFLGSSERQAATTDYLLLSTTRDVYYDGYGPVREFAMQMPGGRPGDYQTAEQTNAERVVDITWGDDVQPTPISDGTYKLVNKATGNTMAVATDGNIVTQPYSGAATQQWEVTRVSPRIGGDYSHYELKQAGTAQTHVNVWNFDMGDMGEVRSYTGNARPDENEQWYFEYAGNGYYHIRNRMNALYLTTVTAGTTGSTDVRQRTLQTATALHDRQLWRLLPTDVDYDTTAPAAPTGLSAESMAAAVRLSWTANAEGDLDGYTVLRATKGTDDWNTIARRISTTHFTDNSCRPGTAYIYKVKAIDRAQNLSAASGAAEAAPTGRRALVARWTMEGNTHDATPHMMDAALSGTPTYTDGARDGGKALHLDGQGGQYLQLPYEAATGRELTVALWARWDGSGGSWQRLFDFGRDTAHYLFLTPANGNNGRLRFAVNNGDGEQQLDAPGALGAGEWKHVAVTMAPGRTAIYIDGQEAAASTAVSISPADVGPVLNYIGRSQFAADPLLTADIDDVRIYNYALTAADVASVAGGGNPAPAKGDANGDGTVDRSDVTAVSHYLTGHTPDGFSATAADMNGDGTVDIVDVTLLIDVLRQQ